MGYTHGILHPTVHKGCNTSVGVVLGMVQTSQPLDSRCGIGVVSEHLILSSTCRPQI